MKTLLLLLIFAIALWAPVIFRIYSWKEGIILTISLSIASYLINRLILDNRKKNDSNEEL